MLIKNSNDNIGDRTRDLPACSAVPQPTVPQAECPLACSNTIRLFATLPRKRSCRVYRAKESSLIYNDLNTLNGVPCRNKTPSGSSECQLNPVNPKCITQSGVLHSSQKFPNEDGNAL